MAKKKTKPLTRDDVMQVLQTRTQLEAAIFLQVSERTIRRIKNDPNHKVLKSTAARIEKNANVDRKRAREIDPDELKRRADETAEREHYKSRLPKKPRGHAKIEIPDIPVIPPVQRLTRIDPRDRKAERRMWSDVIAYDVQHTELKDVINLLYYYSRKRRAAFNIIYTVPKGGTSIGGKTYTKGGQSGTGWMMVGGIDKESQWTLNEIKEFLANIMIGRLRKRHPHNLLYLQVQIMKKSRG